MTFRPVWTSTDFSNRETGKILLDRNENRNLKTSALIQSLGKSVINESLTQYTDLTELYSKAGEILGVHEENLFFTSGADAAIKTFFEYCTMQGASKSVILMNPTYGMYEVYARGFGFEIRNIEYSPLADITDAPVRAILSNLKAAPSGSLFILANPESPTGYIYSPSEISRIVDSCIKNNIFCLIDSTYKKFSPTLSQYNPVSFKQPGIFEVRSFSKDWGLAGVRLGCLLGENKSILSAKLLRPMYEIGSFQSALMIKCFDHSALLDSYCQEVIETRAKFARELSYLNLTVIVTESNFIHIHRSTLGTPQLDALNGLCAYKEFHHTSLNHLIRLTVPDETEVELIVNQLR